jgi:copper chaperone
VEKLTLTIEGMSCGHCVMRVKKALAALPGVAVEDVQIGAARLEYDVASIAPAGIAAAVTEAGYPARAIGGAA